MIMMMIIIYNIYMSSLNPGLQLVYIYIYIIQYTKHLNINPLLQPTYRPVCLQYAQHLINFI